MSQNNRRAAPEKGQKKALRTAFHVTGRFVAFVVTLILVVVALLAIVYRDKLNFDAAKRFVAYGSIAKNDDGLADEFVFSGDNHNSFATLGDGLLLCSNTTLQLYSSSGKQELNLGVSMENPILDTCGEYAVVYDAGGSDLYVFHNTEEIFEYETQNGYNLISAHVNADGYFAIVEQTPGYKATVTVYDGKANRHISLNESSCFVMDAAVSPDNQTLAVVKASQDAAAFHTDVVLYRCSDAGELATAALGDEVMLDMMWKGNDLWVQGKSGVYILSASGEVKGGWTDSLRYLENYTLNGDGFAVLLLSKYRSAGTGELFLINASGEELVSRSISDEVLSISAAGNYIAVLTPGYLTVYNTELEEYASLPASTARKAIMRSDGSVMIIESESAKLYSP